MSAYIITDRQRDTHTQCSTQIEILILRNVSQLYIDMFETSSESGYPSKYLYSARNGCKKTAIPNLGPLNFKKIRHERICSTPPTHTQLRIEQCSIKISSPVKSLCRN